MLIFVLENSLEACYRNSMSDDFEERASSVLGGWGWKRKMAQALGVTESAVQRWLKDDGPGVPGYAWAAVELLESLREERLPYPERWWMRQKT